MGDRITLKWNLREAFQVNINGLYNKHTSQDQIAVAVSGFADQM